MLWAGALGVSSTCRFAECSDRAAGRGDVSVDLDSAARPPYYLVPTELGVLVDIFLRHELRVDQHLAWHRESGQIRGESALCDEPRERHGGRRDSRGEGDVGRDARVAVLDVLEHRVATCGADDEELGAVGLFGRRLRTNVLVVVVVEDGVQAWGCGQ